MCERVLSGRKRSLFVAVGEGRGKERNDCDDDMIWCIVSVDENDRVVCIGP